MLRGGALLGSICKIPFAPGKHGGQERLPAFGVKPDAVRAAIVVEHRSKETGLLNIQRDGNNQPFIAWMQAPGGFKRAWIRHADPTVQNSDWAGTGRYVNVVRTETLGGRPAGQSTDFPVFLDPKIVPDEQVLFAFVAAVCGITGCPIP